MKLGGETSQGIRRGREALAGASRGSFELRG
jgi:hypothetical protein